jgi:two-component system phosphate regulon sensor histidine kinase PhoR
VDQLGAETGIRITIVKRDGEVLADSREDPLLMENHRNRPELRQALDQGFGKALRYSTTLRMRMFYYAIRVDGGPEPEALVRVSLSLQSIDDEVAALHKYLWAAAAGVGLLALLLTFLASGFLMRPLVELKEAAEAVAAGHYDQKTPIRSRDELGMLARAVDRMRGVLTRQVDLLRENSQRLETVLSSMLEGVLAVNAERRVLFANEASKLLLAIETREVVGRQLLEVTRNRVVREAVEEAFRLEEPYEFEFETSGIDRRYLALRATRLPGEPCPGVVVVLYDITELHRLAVVRRDFVANVSHELKTPLASIKAYAETLRLGAIHDTEHNLRFVERIEEQADRLHQLIQDLLQLARVESGREAFDIKAVSLADVVERGTHLYRQRAEQKHQRLDVEPAPEPVLARADEDGLATILDNLVANAIQYTPDGGRVIIRYRAENRHAVLEIEDNGVGIARRDLQRIFERFYRVDKARSRELGGTGLGLAIVKHLTQAFGGQVEVSSEPGKGSVFRVRLVRAGLDQSAVEKVP